MDTTQSEFSSKEIIERLNALELRMSRLEKGVAVVPEEEEAVELGNPFEQFKDISDGSFLESRIGEFGLAWLGNIVLFFGITFLVQHIQNLGHPLFAAIFGLLSAAGIFVLAHFLKTVFPKKVIIFKLNAWLLLFYATLGLHFFSNAPIIASKPVGLFLLLLVVAVQLFVAIRKRSATLAGIALLFLSVIAVVSDMTHFTLSVAVVITALSILFLYRFTWIRLVYLSIFLVYLTFLIWFLSNPVMGHQFQAITVHHFGFIYLFAIAAVYSLVGLVNNTGSSYSKSAIVGSIILNGSGFAVLLGLFTVSFFKDDYTFLLGSVSAYCLLYAVLLQIKSEWKITAALYALFGFVVLSLALHGIYEFPRTYFLLAFQSLLVVSMAIWFRSKFIVIMNTLLFITLLILYLSTSSSIDGVNISFSFVALLTARILNWKKDRLTIQTDMLRNIYLMIGFVMVLFTLYHIMPDRFITLSWTAVAVIYFVLSVVLKNVKYRYLALASMIAAAFYLFIIDLARIGLIYRIMALLFLAIISIGLSVYYTKKSKRKVEK
ncbi:MAG: hypothetical protein L3J66_07640 [Bacteroidales bacterium]|nr:hypothetical protein [Bacteroidales bacterium]